MRKKISTRRQLDEVCQGITVNRRVLWVRDLDASWTRTGELTVISDNHLTGQCTDIRTDE